MAKSRCRRKSAQSAEFAAWMPREDRAATGRPKLGDRTAACPNHAKALSTHAEWRQRDMMTMETGGRHAVGKFLQCISIYNDPKLAVAKLRREDCLTVTTANPLRQRAGCAFSVIGHDLDQLPQFSLPQCSNSARRRAQGCCTCERVYGRSGTQSDAGRGKVEGAEDVILNIKGLIGSTPHASRSGFIGHMLLAVVAVGLCLMAPGAASAGQIVPWQIGLQPSNTLVAEHITSFANLTFWIVGIITLFVLALLIIVMVRFNAKANPVPSKVAHNTLIEVIWTIVPVLILVIIAVPSLRLLYEELEVPPADMTIKAIGRAQWAWGYEYSDILTAKKEPILVDSTILDDSARTDPVKQPRLLSVDNNLVVPVGKVIRVLVTADAESVIHSFAVPSFGLNVDAIP
eukprot:gene24038-25684_t